MTIITGVHLQHFSRQALARLSRQTQGDAVELYTNYCSALSMAISYIMELWSPRLPLPVSRAQEVKFPMPHTRPPAHAAEWIMKPKP